MPYLQLHDQQIPLPEGEVTIGALDGAAVRLPGDDATAHAVLSVGPKGVVIRRGADAAVVLVNGVQLGAEPSPLLHGDRVELGGHELRLGDDSQGGSTQLVSSTDIAALVQAKAGGAPKKPTSATGGRLVSLVDGREYSVSERGVTFGREVGNDIVLASTEVSRKHASIAPAANGYVVTDHSTNGVWVNGLRIQGTQLLGRGDVLKMGSEEFRFYADVAKAASAPATPAAAPAAPAAAPAASPTPAPVAVPVANPTPAPVAVPVAAPAAPVPPPAAAVPPAAAAVPAAPAAAASAPAAPAKPAREPLATLEIRNEGPLKGTTFQIHSALTNIGRGEHNDIAIRDESVSDSHAKIQKRADGWWVVDQGSTNGTYVGGRRVSGEQLLEGAPDLRFGGIKMSFRPAAQPDAKVGATRAIAAADIAAARRAPAKTPALAKAPSPPPAPPAKKAGCGAVIAFFVVLAGSSAGLLSLTLSILR